MARCAAPIKRAMPSEQSPGRYRWRRVIAACGVLTSLVGARRDRPRRPARPRLAVAAVRRRRARRAEPARDPQGAPRAASCSSGAGTSATRPRTSAAPPRPARSSSPRPRPTSSSLHGPDGLIISVSPACREVLGYEPEELVGRAGRGLRARRGPADPARHAQPRARGRRRRARPSDWCAATGGRSGSRRSCASSAARLGPRRRDARRSSATCTSASRPSAALAEAEERFRTAFEEGAAGMAIVSPEGRLLRVNRALCAITGHQPAELEGRSMLSLLHPEDRAQHAQESERMLAGQIAHRARRAPLPARGRPRRLGLGLDDARARRGRRRAALPHPGAGRHRAPPLRGRAAPHGRPRRAHRPAQPPRVRARARAPRRPRLPLRPARRGRADRHRPVQERQRHARPQRGRPADRQGRRRAARAAARRRGDRAPRRRRVRRAGARRQPGGRGARSPPSCSTRSARVRISSHSGRLRNGQRLASASRRSTRAA